MSDATDAARSIKYLNTDLDVEVRGGLPILTAAFQAQQRMYEVSAFDAGDGNGRANFESRSIGRDPETAIGEMLDVIEQLDGAALAVWKACTLRDFNIGYGCGDEPWGFHQRLSAALLQRIAAVGASVSVTIYPVRP